MQGRFEGGISPTELTALLSTKLAKSPLHETANKNTIKTVAWCTGGGQGYIELAADKGLDGYITGEVSEQTIHTAREMNIHFYQPCYQEWCCGGLICLVCVSSAKHLLSH